MTREFKGGLGPQGNWERKEKRITARCVRLKSVAVAPAARLNKVPERGRIDYDDDDDDCLEDTISNDSERDDAWNQFDPMDYHARGW